MIYQEYSVKNWVSPLAVLLLFQVFIMALYLVHPLLPFIFVLAAASIYFLYYLFIKELFIWIMVLSVATGFDEAGRIFGGITIFHISWFLAMIAMFIYVFYNKGFKLKIASPINKYVFAYIGFSLFSLIYSPNKESGFFYLLTTTALFMFFIFVMNFAKEPRHFKFIISALLVVNVLISFYMFYQLLNFDPWQIGDPTESSTGEKISRSSGTFQDPNVAATYIIIGSIFGIGLLMYAGISLRYKLFILGATLISFAGILATFSRTGWLSLGFGLFILLLFQKNKKVIVYSLLGFVLSIAAIILFTKYGAFILNRIVTVVDVMGDVSIRTRIFMAVSGIWMFLDNPVLGIGYRGFPVLYDFYLHPLAPQILLYVKESHTLVITLLAETGLIGVVIVFKWFKRVFKDNWSLIKHSDNRFYRALLIGCFANFAALNLNFFFYGSLFPHFDLIWLVFGFIYSIYFMNTKLIDSKAAEAASNN